MLVLTRKAGETIFIGDNIAVTISTIRGNQVKVAIKAPKEIAIMREELLEDNDPRLELLN